MGISNFVALKEIVASYDTASLDAVVQAINIKLSLSVEADNKAASQQRHAASHRQKAESHRLDAALILVDLRQRVEADGHSWWKWQEGKFTRSRKDIEKLLRMAKAEKPEVAAETERTQTRGRVRAHRTLERTVRSKKKRTRLCPVLSRRIARVAEPTRNAGTTALARLLVMPFPSAIFGNGNLVNGKSIRFLLLW